MDSINLNHRVDLADEREAPEEAERASHEPEEEGDRAGREIGHAADDPPRSAGSG